MEDVLLILPSWKLTAAALCSRSFHQPDPAAAVETSRDLRSHARKTVLVVLVKKKKNCGMNSSYVAQLTRNTLLQARQVKWLHMNASFSINIFVTCQISLFGYATKLTIFATEHFHRRRKKNSTRQKTFRHFFLLHDLKQNSSGSP